MHDSSPDATPSSREREQSRVAGILVTYQRADLLKQTLHSIAQQTQSLDQILVVDNENSAAMRDLIETMASRFMPCRLRYLASPKNLGSAGGWALGMRQIAMEDEYDWIMPLDDDDPPKNPRDFERMITFADDSKQTHPNLGAVGIVGAIFNWGRGLIERLPDEALTGSVPVDFVGCGYMPLYHRDAMNRVGVFDEKLFFGYTEVEYGIRLKKNQFEILANSEMWIERRSAENRMGIRPKPSRVCVISPRKYYAIRNHIYIMLKYGQFDLAIKQAAIQCFAKPLFTLFVNPSKAVPGFCQAAKACWHGFRGKMGSRVLLTSQGRDSFPWLLEQDAQTQTPGKTPASSA